MRLVRRTWNWVRHIPTVIFLICVVLPTGLLLGVVLGSYLAPMFWGPP